MNKSFRAELTKLQQQASVQSKLQLLHGSLLSEILSTLKHFNLNIDPNPTSPKTPEAANHPQVSTAGNSNGVAGNG
jgi:hypothetical protein